MEEKIVQIIPAPQGLLTEYYDDDELFTMRVVCLALTDEGDVVMMDIGDDGYIEITNSHRGIRWEKQP